MEVEADGAGVARGHLDGEGVGALEKVLREVPALERVDVADDGGGPGGVGEGGRVGCEAVTIGVRALDAADNVVADGSLTASDLDISKQNVVTIQISPVTVGLPDGGGPRDANVNEPDASPISDGMGALDANGPMGFDGGVDVGAPLDAAPLPDAAERLDAAAPDAAPDAEADADVM